MESDSSPGCIGRFSAWLEAVILTRLMSRDSPGPFFRLIFKIPILYFRLGVGGFFYPPTLLLTTTGRKTGRLHATPLEYTYDGMSNTYKVSAGWGGKTDWYRNARANPQVTLQVGRLVFQATAEPCPDEEAGRQMFEISRRVRVMDRVWQHWSDRPLDGTPESYIYAARFFPSLKLIPCSKNEKPV